jgi:hypothetical protein
MKLSKNYYIEGKIFQKGTKLKIVSKFMESYLQDIESALYRISSLLHDNDINFTIIGGVANNIYSNNPRTTEDIDILVSDKDRDKMKNLPIGFIRDRTGNGRSFNFHGPKAQIDVVYSGEKAGSNRGIDYLEPNEITIFHNSIPFIDLEDLVQVKLSAGEYGNRFKDFGDVQELIKSNNLDRLYARNNNFRDDLILIYEQIWDKTL